MHEQSARTPLANLPSRTQRILCELSRRYAPVFTRAEALAIAAGEARRFGGRVLRDGECIQVQLPGGAVLRLIRVGRNRWQQQNLAPGACASRLTRTLIERLEGKYTPVYSTARMRAIIEYEAGERAASGYVGALVANLNLPGCGPVLRFTRLGPNRWQPEIQAPRCVR